MSAPLGQTIVPATASSVALRKKAGVRRGMKIGPSRSGRRFTLLRRPSWKRRSSECGPATVKPTTRQFIILGLRTTSGERSVATGAVIEPTPSHVRVPRGDLPSILAQAHGRGEGGCHEECGTD